MKTRVLVILLAAAVLFGCSPLSTAAESPAVSPFSDVTPDNWYYSYVVDLYRQGVVNGAPDGAFYPNDVITWGQAMKMILGAVGVKVEAATTGKNWALDYLQPAIDHRLVYASYDRALLNKPVDRLNIAQMTARAMQLISLAGPSPYADCDDGYVVELYEKGIMVGAADGNFHPERTATRAEIAAVVWRVMNSTYQEGMTRVSNYWVDLFDNVPRSEFTRSQFSTDYRGRVNYLNNQSVLGIDVSEHQGDIDWYSVKADGIDFVIVRVGGRFLSSGAVFEDACWRQNVEGALEAGLNVGVYFFSQALNEEEGLEEAEYVLDLIEDYRDGIDYPVICDWEYLGNYSSTNHARTYLCEPTPVTDGIEAFCRRVEEEGYTAGVYFNEYCGMIKMDLSRLADYEFWFAEYGRYPSCLYQSRMWQYSSGGQVNGIRSDTDMDICFIPYAPVKPATPRPEPEPGPDQNSAEDETSSALF